MKKKLCLIRILGFISVFLSLPVLLKAQQVVRGNVIDSKGNNLPAVSVVVKNTITGVLTAEDGTFSITVPNSKTVLVFSSVGFATQEIPVNGQTNLKVTLLDGSQQLGELVVTAIGIKQQKKRLGFTTQEVKTEQLANSRTMNLGTALSGQVAGLTVTTPTGMFQKPQFQLRGKSPLIVIDGVPVETDFYDVSGEDIENINVLKGIAASALYGTRGKDGAILITTKNAKKEGLEVNVNTNNMFTAGFTVFPKTQTEYGSGSNGQYEFWDGADGGISDGDMTWGPKLNAGLKIAQWNSPIRDKQTGQTIDWYGDVKGTIYDDRSRYERVPTDFVYHNNLKDFLRTGIVSTNSFSVAYKGEKTRFYASGKYAHQKGQVPNMSLNTGGLNFNAAFDISKNFTLETSLSYNKVFTPNYPRYGYGPKNHIYTILIWMSDDVNGQDLKNHMWVPGLEGYRQANYNYAWYNNPYFASNMLSQAQNRDVVDMQVKANWKINNDLVFQIRGNGRNTTNFESMKSPKSYMNYGDSRNGDYKIWNTRQLNFDADALLSYNKTINDNIQFGVNAGTSVFNRTYTQEYQSSDGLIVPEVYSLNNTQGPVQASNYRGDKSIRSIYAAANLDFYNAFFLSLTARNDWSSTLPTNNNSYFYPSISLSTMISELVKMPDFVGYLKLYGSWAQVSSDLAPYSIYSAYNKGTTYGSTQSVYYPSGIVNPNILPEKSSSYEVGLSSGLFKDRLTVDLTYYNIKDENQIIDLGISEASGFTSRKVNGNVYTTKGLEIVAGVKAIKNKNFRWDVAANWSKYVKKITEIYGDQAVFGNLKLGDRTDSYYTTVWQKSADGKLILGANGLPIRDPFARNIGHLDPSWRLGFQNKFNIKGFDIGIDIDGVWGGIMNSTTHEKMWWGGKHPNSVEYRDAEYAAGHPVYVPDGVVVVGGELKQDIYGNVISDTRKYAPNTTAVSWQTWGQNYPYRARVTESESKQFANTFDRSFFKLRRVSVGYELGKVFNLGKTVKGLYVQAFGYNLAMWKKMPLLDPDYEIGNDGNLQDPSPRYVGFSVNVKF
ncbi:SusC/RagA family TonB-linked outer membrane protein [Chitinophaga silvatica]|uniref:SusC/RagA family TonB-linked outer membrane protein n=1 Tax=Chitinophaga silvatica TaxID=2282649 RepID=A0A3E1YAS8_9BACT|nr:SusC/RagA family TonB-linked outer membrane protein [Chitinophaga silvatica]RFS22581.1 SusC/RagA family TonB-linked outer membrane protein [Chitinophaga silvatica]